MTVISLLCNYISSNEKQEIKKIKSISLVILIIKNFNSKLIYRSIIQCVC